MNPPSNLFESSEEREFWRWVNPNNFNETHNITITGTLTSNVMPGEDALFFIPNPNFKGSIGGYQNSLVTRYLAEYNLEIDRRRWYPKYPSRLNALYICESKQEALLYSQLNPRHCESRVLKRCMTQGNYLYSVHDQSWFEFSTVGHAMDPETINNVSHAYWRGEQVGDNELQSMGKRWEKESVMEVLFLGQVVFPNKELTSDE